MPALILSSSLISSCSSPLAKTDSGSRTLIVIYALDELQAGSQRMQLLRLVSNALPKLPVHVKLLLTSRPEDDIVAAFKMLKPLTLVKTGDTTDFQKSDEQRADVYKFLAEKLQATDYVRENRSMAGGKQLELLLNATQGVFLSARLLVVKAASLSADLNIDQAVQELQRAASPFGAYKETLERIDERLQAMSDGNDENYEIFFKAFKSILDVLVCAEAPLHRDNIATFSSAYAGQRSPSWTKQLLNALSLMFTERSGSGLMEPIHKTVMDYLSTSEAGKFEASRLNGCATLALACSSVLSQELSRQVPGKMGSFVPSNALRHALLYGHVT